MSATKLNDGERAELLALYQVTTQDLAFFKSQQWTLTNYALVALAAVAGVSQIPGLRVTTSATVLLCISASVMVLLTAWLLDRLQGSIAERRSRLASLYERFSDEFRVARGIKLSASAWETIAPLWTVLFLAFALVLWILIATAPEWQ